METAQIGLERRREASAGVTLTDLDRQIRDWFRAEC